MHSTEPTTLLLPVPATRPAIRGFWLLMSGGVGVLAGVGSAVVLDAPARAATIGVTTAVLFAIPGLLLPYDVAVAYRGWNALARVFSTAASRYVTAVCFWTVMRALSAAGPTGRFPAGAPGAGGWQQRRTLKPDEYADQYGAPAASTDPGWSGRLRRWMTDAAPDFSWTLLPFLLLLRLLATGARGERRAAAHIYTLY